MKKILLTLGIVLLVSQSWGSTYYVKTGGNDNLSGLSDAEAWATIAKVQAMAKSGDVVYFRSQDTWTSSAQPVLLANAGVTYDGSTYGSGARAKFLSGAEPTAYHMSAISIGVSSVIFKGFEVDGNSNDSYGIYIGEGSNVDLSNITIDNCYVHNVGNPINTAWVYGILVSSKAGNGVSSGTGLLTCSDGSATNPIISSTGYSFVAGDAGKQFSIKSAGTGFVIGVYTIVSVANGKASLDRSCGSAGALSGGVWWFNGIAINSVNITNTIVRNCTHEGIALYQAWGYFSNHTDGVLVRNCEVYNNLVGILVANDSDNVIIEYCNIYNNTNEGIWERTSPEGNNGSPDNCAIRYNIIHDNPNAGFSTQTGLVKALNADIYGNLFYNNGVFDIDIDNGDFNPGVFNIYNNTIYNTASKTGYGVVSITPYSNVVTYRPQINFKNNIIYTGTVTPVYDHWGFMAHSNNLIFRTSGATNTHVSSNGVTYNRTAVQSTWEPSSKITDPIFTGGTFPSGFIGTFGNNIVPNTNYFTIISGDAVDNGVTLGSPYNSSINGAGLSTPVTRPQGAAYDIGAYEYVGSSSSPLLVPSNLRLTN